VFTIYAAASDKVYYFLAHGRWFSPGTPASSTTKTGRHDIAEILLKVALNTKNQINQIKPKCNIITVFTIYACTEEGEYENKHIKSAQNYFIHHECVIYY
jgi:hypothetical protein